MEKAVNKDIISKSFLTTDNKLEPDLNEDYQHQVEGTDKHVDRLGVQASKTADNSNSFEYTQQSTVRLNVQNSIFKKGRNNYRRNESQKSITLDVTPNKFGYRHNSIAPQSNVYSTKQKFIHNRDDKVRGGKVSVGHTPKQVDRASNSNLGLGLQLPEIDRNTQQTLQSLVSTITSRKRLSGNDYQAMTLSNRKPVRLPILFGKNFL